MPFKMADEQEPNPQDTLIWKSSGKIIVALTSWTMGLLKFYQSPNLLLQSSMLEFVCVYLVGILVVGIPIAFLELSLSQYSSKSVIKSWGFCPLFKGIGYAKVATLFIFQVYYNVLNGYALFYAATIYKSVIEWKHCTAAWIHETCYNFSTSFDEAVGTNETNWRSSSEQYWLYKILSVDKNVKTLSWPNWEIAAYFFVHLFFLFITTYKGPKMLNNVLPVLLVIALIELTILMVITSYTVGGMLGLTYLFKLDIDLNNVLPWVKNSLSSRVFNDILLSLGLGVGGLSFLGSKFSFRQATHAHAISLNMINISFIIITTIITYNIYGILSYHSNVPLEKLVSSQSQHYFSQTLFTLVPNVFKFLPGNEKLWIFVFYSCVYITGFSSSIIMLSVIQEVLYDSRTNTQNQLASIFGIFLTCAFGMVLHTNTGPIIQEYLNDVTMTTLIPILVSLECIVLIFCYGLMNFFDDIHFMFGHRPFCYWHVTLLLSPFLLSIITVFPIIDFYSSEKYEYYMKFEFMNVLQKCILCCVLVWIPFMGMVHIIKKGNWKMVFQPSESWGPENNMLRTSRLNFNDDESTKEYVYQKNLLAMKLNINNDSDDNYY